jgi:hypothetical protein
MAHGPVSVAWSAYLWLAYCILIKTWSASDGDFRWLCIQPCLGFAGWFVVAYTMPQLTRDAGSGERLSYEVKLALVVCQTLLGGTAGWLSSCVSYTPPEGTTRTQQFLFGPCLALCSYFSTMRNGFNIEAFTMQYVGHVVGSKVQLLSRHHRLASLLDTAVAGAASCGVRWDGYDRAGKWRDDARAG